MDKARTVYLLLGGNLGDTIWYFAQAKSHISKKLGDVVLESSVYETEPWGFATEDVFYNQVVCIRSTLSPLRMLGEVFSIEHRLGRVREPGIMLPRTIDIDILFIDNMIMSEPGLEVPHPRLHLRRFALEPLNEIAPDLVHPIFHVTVSDLLGMCDDALKVNRLPGNMTG